MCPRQVAESALGIIRRFLHDCADLCSDLRQPSLQAIPLDGPDEGCGVLAIQRWRPPVVLQYTTGMSKGTN